MPEVRPQLPKLPNSQKMPVKKVEGVPDESLNIGLKLRAAINIVKKLLL